MAQKVIKTLLDDYEAHQGNGDVEAAETVEFGLDGTSYEIDLSQVNASGLRQSLEDYVAAARKVSGRGRRSASSTSGSTPKSSSATSGPADREENKLKRAFWEEVAGQNPTAVPPFAKRGRIPDTVSELYSRTGGDPSRVPQGATGATAGAPAPVADTSVAQEPTSTSTDEGPRHSADDNLPEGWWRDGEGQLRDEDGFDREESELAGV